MISSDLKKGKQFAVLFQGRSPLTPSNLDGTGLWKLKGKREGQEAKTPRMELGDGFNLESRGSAVPAHNS